MTRFEHLLDFAWMMHPPIIDCDALSAACAPASSCFYSQSSSQGTAGGRQTTQVTAFVTDDAVRKDRPGVNESTVPGGYRSSLGGTLAGGGGGGGNDGVEVIRVSRVASDPGNGDDGGDASRRPSSAPGPRPQKDGSAGSHNFFPSPADRRIASGNSGAGAAGVATSAPADRLARSLPGSPSKRTGPGGRTLSVTVKKLLGTKDGLNKLRASLQDDDDPKGMAAAAREVQEAMGNAERLVAMSKGEAVARAAGQGAAGLAAGRLSGILAGRRPGSAPSRGTEVTKKASVFEGLVQTLVESNVSQAQKKRYRFCRARWDGFLFELGSIGLCRSRACSQPGPLIFSPREDVR